MAYRITNQLDSASPSDLSATNGGDDAQSTATGPTAGGAGGSGGGGQRNSVLSTGTGGGLSAAGGSSLGGGLGAGGSVNGSGIGAGNGTGRKMDEDEERDAVFARLEGLGYRVGQGLVERYVFSLFFPGLSKRLLVCFFRAERCCARNTGARMKDNG